MRQPWGLSGTQFAVVYLIVFLVSVALVFGVRELAGRRHGAAEDPSLTPYQLAFLAGGANRVLVLGLADLLATGRAHLSRDGRLTMDSGYEYSDPIQRTVAENLKVAGKWAKRARTMRDDRALREVIDRLATAGLVLRGRDLNRWSGLMLLPVAVFVAGLVQLAFGAPKDASTAVLALLLVGSAGVLRVAVPFLRWQGTWPSPRGVALIKRLRSEHAEDRTDEARRRELPEIPQTAIAVLGTSAVLDMDMLRIINGPGVRADFLGAAGGYASTSPPGCNG
jgi:uncharacterized protein (TIGR04222 family)